MNAIVIDLTRYASAAAAAHAELDALRKTVTLRIMRETDARDRLAEAHELLACAEEIAEGNIEP